MEVEAFGKNRFFPLSALTDHNFYLLSSISYLPSSIFKISLQLLISFNIYHEISLRRASLL